MKNYYEKIEKFENINIFGDGPGCFGGYWGVIPEYFYGIFEGFLKVEFSKIKHWSKSV